MYPCNFLFDDASISQHFHAICYKYKRVGLSQRVTSQAKWNKYTVIRIYDVLRLFDNTELKYVQASTRHLTDPILQIS